MKAEDFTLENQIKLTQMALSLWIQKVQPHQVSTGLEKYSSADGAHRDLGGWMGTWKEFQDVGLRWTTPIVSDWKGAESHRNQPALPALGMWLDGAVVPLPPSRGAALIFGNENMFAHVGLHIHVPTLGYAAGWVHNESKMVNKVSDYEIVIQRLKAQLQVLRHTLANRHKTL